MPTYSYYCTACDKHFDVVKKLAQLDRVEFCACTAQAVRHITAPAVQGDYEEYSCPITGKPIRGRVAHEDNLKRHDCRVYESGETEAFIRNKANRERQAKKEFDALVDHCVSTTAQEMGIGS